MRFLKIIILCNLIVTLQSLAAWEPLTPPSTAHFYGLYALDSEHFWVVGDTGTIYEFSEGSWLPHESSTTATLKDICMTGPNEGWAVGLQGTMLHYLDGIWQPVSGWDEQSAFERVVALAPDKVYFLQYGLITGSIFYYWDGASFNIIYRTGQNLRDVCIVSPQNIWLVGGVDFRVHYNGANWTQDTSPLTHRTKLMAVGVDKKGYPIACGTDNDFWDRAIVIRKQPDGSWLEEYYDFRPMLSDIAIAGNREIAVGWDGFVIENTLLGWGQVDAQTPQQLNKIQLLDGSEGFAVGNKGTILRYRMQSIATTASPEHVLTGQTLSVSTEIVNPLPSTQADVFIILDAYGAFYFWPAWSDTVDFRKQTLNASSRETLPLFTFEWPEGTGSGFVTFWSALLSGDTILSYDIEPLTWN